MSEPNILILAGGISSRMKRSASAAHAIEAALVDDAVHKSASGPLTVRSSIIFL